MAVKWYAIHLPIEIVNGITKRPVSICSDVSEGFDLKKLQNKFGLDNIVELPRRPLSDDKYDKATKKLDKLV